ncbi:MAG: hypothetical protein HY275_05815 [Gemmatimonadetes bacterium]|nr:hypothetical protein [Gemmatimonadota bacterium]
MLPLTYAVTLLQFALFSARTDSLQILVGPIEPATASASVRGIAELFPDVPGRAFLVLRLARGVPGAEHAFQLWRGRCGDEREQVPVVAPAIARLDENGRGKATEEVILDLPDDGPFHVVIRAGTAGTGPVAGCANLSGNQGAA